jgi:hypothetical protein
MQWSDLPREFLTTWEKLEDFKRHFPQALGLAGSFGRAVLARLMLHCLKMKTLSRKLKLLLGRAGATGSAGPATRCRVLNGPSSTLV